MSTTSESTTTSTEAVPGTGTVKKPSHSANMAWARKTGVAQYNPIQPNQTKWQGHKHWPEVMRIWSFMVNHCCNWYNLSTYAVDRDGHEMHIENAAEEERMDEANARRGWRLGVRMGLWGNRPHKNDKADKYSGRRRMYWYGDVDLDRAEREAGLPDPGEKPAPQDREKVCTDLFGRSIWLQIKERPDEEIEIMIGEEEAEQELATALHADIVAAYRLFITQREDSRYARWRVKPNRQKHEFKNGHAAEYSERQELVKEVYAPVLLPLLETAVTKRSVQTSTDSVQSTETSEYTPPEKESTAGVSLSGLDGERKTRRVERAGGSDATSGHIKTPPVEQKSAPKLEPMPKQSEPSEAERKALDLLFSKTREMQNAYPRTKFGSDLVDPRNKGDQAWARRVLGELSSPAEMEGFVYQVGVNLGLIKPALGKLPRPKDTPAHNPHDRYIGLIYEWARDWTRDAAGRQKQLEVDREAKARRDELARVQNEKAAKQEAQWQEVEAAWLELPAKERQSYLDISAAGLKADPNFKNIKLSVRNSEIELRAKKLLRGSMFEGKAVGGDE